jgi:hypothetical protein
MKSLQEEVRWGGYNWRLEEGVLAVGGERGEGENFQRA